MTREVSARGRLVQGTLLAGLTPLVVFFLIALVVGPWRVDGVIGVAFGLLLVGVAGFVGSAIARSSHMVVGAVAGALFAGQALFSGEVALVFKTLFAASLLVPGALGGFLARRMEIEVATLADAHETVLGIGGVLFVTGLAMGAAGAGHFDATDGTPAPPHRSFERVVAPPVGVPLESGLERTYADAHVWTPDDVGAPWPSDAEGVGLLFTREVLGWEEPTLTPGDVGPHEATYFVTSPAVDTDPLQLDLRTDRRFRWVITKVGDSPTVRVSADNDLDEPGLIVTGYPDAVAIRILVRERGETRWLDPPVPAPLSYRIDAVPRWTEAILVLYLDEDRRVTGAVGGTL